MNILEMANAMENDFDELLQLDIVGFETLLNRKLTEQEIGYISKALTYNLTEDPKGYARIMINLTNMVNEVIMNENFDNSAYLDRVKPLMEDPRYKAWEKTTKEIGEKILPVIMPFIADELVDEDEDL